MAGTDIGRGWAYGRRMVSGAVISQTTPPPPSPILLSKATNNNCLQVLLAEK